MESIHVTGLQPEKSEKLARLLEKLADNSDVIEELLDTLNKLRETGILGGASALAEGFEEGFNYMMKPEFMASVSNMMMMLYFMSRLDNPMMYEVAEKLPPCLSRAYNEFKQTPKKKTGLFELLSIMRSPEFHGMLKAMQAMLSCFKEE